MDMELPSGRELVEEIYAKKDAEIDALREQNRVLREALRQALDDIPGWVMLASDALTATRQEGQG